MRKIYTSIELGSYSIKIIVSEIVGNTPRVIASSNTRCKGIKNGLIEDSDLVKAYLLSGIKKVEEMLGFSITEAIIGINSVEKSFDILSGEVKIDNEKGIVTDSEIEKVYEEIVIGNVMDSEELLTIMPISFQVDNKELTKDPKGLLGKKLALKAVIVKIPKSSLRPYLELFRECGIKVVDVTLGAIGDYYQAKNKDFDNAVSAIINLGYDKIDVSIYNKGIMIKYDSCYEGSRLIDKDLAYMYKIKTGQARKLKENFAVATTKYADGDDTMELTTKDGKKLIVNQLNVSEVVEARIVYLLEQAKNQISLLTNREISNIIITGGISELVGFSSICENVFENRALVLDMKTMGIRSNMYSSCFGLIKYFHNKLDFRGINYSMIKDDDVNTLSKANSNKKDNNIINKVI